MFEGCEPFGVPWSVPGHFRGGSAVPDDDVGPAFRAADRGEDEACRVDAASAGFQVEAAEDAVGDDGCFGEVEGAARAAVWSGSEWDESVAFGFGFEPPFGAVCLGFGVEVRVVVQCGCRQEEQGSFANSVAAQDDVLSQRGGQGREDRGLHAQCLGVARLGVAVGDGCAGLGGDCGAWFGVVQQVLGSPGVAEDRGVVPGDGEGGDDVAQTLVGPGWVLPCAAFDEPGRDAVVGAGAQFGDLAVEELVGVFA
ncbi:hypothetical protein NONI108955_23605 [Nocardia ninae]